MITTAAEYKKYLYRIQSDNLQDRALLIPSNEPIYEVNLQNRTIKGPANLSVAQDHRAEVVYFKIPRFFEGIDLTDMTGIVQYINANNVGGIYPIPFYDTITEPGFILCPWAISGEATEKAGNVKYNIVFYHIVENADSESGYVFDFKLVTQPATGKVLVGMDVSEEAREKYHITANILDEVNQRLKEYADNAGVYWLDLSNK